MVRMSGVVDCGDGVLTGRIMEKATWWLQRDGRGGRRHMGLARQKPRAKDYKHGHVSETAGGLCRVCILEIRGKSLEFVQWSLVSRNGVSSRSSLHGKVCNKGQ